MWSSARLRTIYYISWRRVNLLKNQFHLFSNDSWDSQEGLTNFNRIIDFIQFVVSFWWCCLAEWRKEREEDRDQLINQSISDLGKSILHKVQMLGIQPCLKFTSSRCGMFCCSGSEWWRLTTILSPRHPFCITVCIFKCNTQQNKWDASAISANEGKTDDTDDGYHCVCLPLPAFLLLLSFSLPPLTPFFPLISFILQSFRCPLDK